MRAGTHNHSTSGDTDSELIKKLSQFVRGHCYRTYHSTFPECYGATLPLFKRSIVKPIIQFLILPSFLFLLLGCTPSQEVLEATVVAAVAQTQEALVTDTPIPTNTSTPTLTPTSTPTNTATPTPTDTATPTVTSTPTITLTPAGPLVRVKTSGTVKAAPRDGAANGFYATKDDFVAVIGRTEDGSWFQIQSMNANADKGWCPAGRLELTDEVALADLPVPTVTATSTNTPIPTNTPDIRGEYVEMDIRELEAYASRYIGDKVKLRGEVFNIMGDGLQMWVREPGGGSLDNVAVVVTWIDNQVLPDQVYEDTWITVYATVLGTYSGTNAYGGTIEQPWVLADIIER